MKNIVKNKRGLHNRLTYKIKLPQFTLAECEEYAGYRKLGYSREMILEIYMDVVSALGEKKLGLTRSETSRRCTLSAAIHYPIRK